MMKKKNNKNKLNIKIPDINIDTSIHPKRRQAIYSLTSIVVVIDIITKLLVSSKLKEDSALTIISNFFSLYYVKNTGAAFSLFQNSLIFLIILSVVILLVLDNYIKKEKNMTKLTEVSLGLIMGGIYGNLVDRIINHSVTDFLSFKIFNYNFPVFNIADICITIGSIILLVSLFIDYRKEKKNER